MPTVNSIAPFLQDRTWIAASHLGSRILDHDSASTFQVRLHAAQQVGFSITGISSHDDAPTRLHLVAEKPLDTAFNVQPLEISIRQRFRDRLPACRGKRTPQRGAVAYDRRLRRASSPLVHSLTSPLAWAATSPRGTKPSSGKAAMVDS